MLGGVMSDRVNFQNIGNALQTLFIISTGEQWPQIMHDFQKDYSS